MELNPHHPGWLHYVARHRSLSQRRVRAQRCSTRQTLEHAAVHLDASLRHRRGRTTRPRGRMRAPASTVIRKNDPRVSRARYGTARVVAVDSGIAELLDRVDGRVRESEGARRSAGGPASSLSSADRGRNRSPDRGASIAVMPFADLSPAKDQEWFCDGIAEEILNALTPLKNLRVAAKASAFSLRGKSDDLKTIGEKLNVTTVLGGSVRRAGDRVRITVQLSEVATGFQLWSERYDRELRDIFDMQDEIAIGDRRSPQGDARTTIRSIGWRGWSSGERPMSRRISAICRAARCWRAAAASVAQAHRAVSRGGRARSRLLAGLVGHRRRATACWSTSVVVPRRRVEGARRSPQRRAPSSSSRRRRPATRRWRARC